MVLFGEDRWARVREVYRDYWNHKLNRPVAGVIIVDKDPGRLAPKAPLLSQANCNDFSFTPEELVDRIDYEMSQYTFLGDAFPQFNMNCFGPGVMAAFLGARLDNSTGNVWFHPKENLDIEDLRFEYDGDNKYLKRIKNIYKAAMNRFEGNVLMGMVDMGGILDVLSSFLPGEQLLFSLYDHPETVKKLAKELDRLWQCFYDDLHSVLRPVNPGYSDWSTYYSETPSYIIQCDFAYMIGNDMFGEFALDGIKAHCKNLDKTVYHLDGTGQLAHLDDLLAIKELDGIQWVPGEGEKPLDEWIEVYQKIAEHNKLMQLCWCGFDVMDNVINAVGHGGLFQHPLMYGDASFKEFALSKLKKYHIEL